MELSLLDCLVMWLSRVCMHCVWQCVFVNASWGLNDDKQMPAVGASTHNLASLPGEITAQHLCATLQAHTWLHCGGVLERGKWISLIPSLFNKLIKLSVLHPEAILKWLSHSSVMLLIDGGRKGAQEGGTMKEGTAERCGGRGMEKGQIRQSWNSCV